MGKIRQFVKKMLKLSKFPSIISNEIQGNKGNHNANNNIAVGVEKDASVDKMTSNNKENRSESKTIIKNQSVNLNKSF